MSSNRLSIVDATAQLTAPGQMFEMDTATVLGTPMNVWKHAPATLRQILDLSLNHATREFLVYEEQRLTFDEHYRQPLPVLCTITFRSRVWPGAIEPSAKVPLPFVTAVPVGASRAMSGAV